MDKPMLVFKRFSIPSLLTRTTNDITKIQMLFTMGLQVVTRGPIMAIWAIGKILGKLEYWIWAVVVESLSTIRNADLILVMKEGNIIEQGNHNELMVQDGFYADLYNSQFTEDQAEE